MVPPSDRVAFSIFGIDVMWYAIFIVTGMFLCFYAVYREVKRRGLDIEAIEDLPLWVIPIGIIGARIYYVIFEWDYYRGDLLKILNIRNGGLAIHGGLIAGVIAGYIYCRRKNLKPLEMLDICFPSVAMAQGIGRWGNFFNQEAHGRETSLPIYVLIDGKHYHATFLYESVGDILIFIFLTYYNKKMVKNDGETFCLYLILYGILRFIVESFRTDSLYFMNIRVAQLVSLIGIIVGLIGFIYLRKFKKVDEKN